MNTSKQKREGRNKERKNWFQVLGCKHTGWKTKDEEGVEWEQITPYPTLEDGILESFGLSKKKVRKQKVVYAEIRTNPASQFFPVFFPEYKGSEGGVDVYNLNDSLDYLASEGFIPVTDKFFWKKV